MTNEITIREEATPTVKKNTRTTSINSSGSTAMIDKERVGKLVDEFVDSIKDTRLNTKRAIAADIAATARVQNQNDRAIAVYERELRRRDLSPERRDELVDRITMATESTASVCTESREFQRIQLDRSRSITRWIIGGLIILVGGGIGGAALLNARA